jgi:beta-phosphoglucomutase
VYDAILFDFDGVLADTEPLHFECWREILAPFDIHLNWPFYRERCVGISDRTMVERLAAERVPPLEWEHVMPAYHRKLGLFRERLEANPPFHESTIELVRELAASYKLAVVSSSGRGEVEDPIVRAGLREHFQAFVCGRDQVRNLKPAPDPYLFAAKLIGAKRPLVVEDSDAGVASGRAAGFDVVRVTSADKVAEQVRLAIGNAVAIDIA